MYRCFVPNFVQNASLFIKLSCFLSEGVPKLIVYTVCTVFTWNHSSITRVLIKMRIRKKSPTGKLKHPPLDISRIKYVNIENVTQNFVGFPGFWIGRNFQRRHFCNWNTINVSCGIRPFCVVAIQNCVRLCVHVWGGLFFGCSNVAKDCVYGVLILGDLKSLGKYERGVFIDM